MAEISREYLEAKRSEYQAAILQLQGAVEAINQMIDAFYPPAAVTTAELGKMIGAAEVGKPEPLEGRQE